MYPFSCKAKIVKKPLGKRNFLCKGYKKQFIIDYQYKVVNYQIKMLII